MAPVWGLSVLGFGSKNIAILGNFHANLLSCLAAWLLGPIIVQFQHTGNG